MCVCSCVRVCVVIFSSSTIHSFTDSGLFAPILSNFAVNWDVQISVGVSAASSFGCMHRSGIAGLGGNSMLVASRRHSAVSIADTRMAFPPAKGRAPSFPTHCHSL